VKLILGTKTLGYLCVEEEHLVRVIKIYLNRPVNL